MNQLRRALREEPDRLLAHTLFVVYGVVALYDPPVSQSSTPELFALIFNVEFVVLGSLLFLGTIRQSYILRLAGYTLYIITLVTMAALIGFRGSPVAIIVLAFAVRGYTSVREIQASGKFLKDLRRVFKDSSGDENGRS